MSESFLSAIHAFLLEQGLGKARVAILTKQLGKHGGEAMQTLSETTTHILVGNKIKLARVPVLLKKDTIPDGVSILRADWLSGCLVKRQVIPEESYRLHTECPPVAKVKVTPAPSQTSPQKMSKLPKAAELGEGTSSGAESSMCDPKAGMFNVTSRRWKKSPKKKSAAKPENDWDSSDSNYVESDEEPEKIKSGTEKDGEGIGEESEAAEPPKKKGRWVCEMSSTSAQTWVNHNKHITDKLQELLVVYQNNGEKWRAMSTIKAIQAIKKHPKEIKTLEDAKEVQFIGERLANKVFEIVSTGRLRRLDNVDKERERIIDMFKNIHGVGTITAQQYYAQGYRTLQDLKDANILSRVQQIGVRHFDDFLERMQREEVAEIEAKVKEIAHSIDTGLEVVTCGSYRRGKPTCGDIDILVTHPDGRSHRRLMSTFLEKGHECGFLTDDLSVHDSDANGSGKYLGVCKLEGEGRKYRRIDIMVVPYCEFPLALLHFTGSGHMNRSMRSKADKMGMSLSEHALCTGVIRKNGVKIFDGTPLPVTCEEDVFRYLELEYKEPKERDWD